MSEPSSRLELIALSDFPRVQPGDDLVGLLADSLIRNELQLRDGDVIVVAQKIVSKAEHRYRRLADVLVSDRAKILAAEVDKNPALVELILQESTAVIRQRPGVLIVEHRLGFVHANAGIDQSNIDQSTDDPLALLLPAQPDHSAQALREGLQSRCAVSLRVIINDSAGRAWRNGTCGIAIGSAGFETVVDLIGQQDMFGQELRVTTVGVADELAAAASFLMGQAAEAMPVVVIRGAKLRDSSTATAQDLIRDKAIDLFR